MKTTKVQAVLLSVWNPLEIDLIEADGDYDHFEMIHQSLVQ